MQYFEGCPNVGIMRERLAAAGIDSDRVKLVEASSPEVAATIGFRGSPTVLVNDEDPFAGESAPPGYACRVYRTEVGLEGAPSVSQLVAAIGR